MKKLTFASIVSACMVPILFWSQDSSAIPAFARKYQTSCYTCHSGFPARNAFGEAFRNNGYRWPGGEDEEHAKQEQTKMGADGWKKTFPSSPWPTDIPGFAPFAFWIRGNVLTYTEESLKPDGTRATPSTFNWGNSPLGNATLFFGGSMGDNFSAFGSYNISATTTEKNNVNTTAVTSGARGRIVWAFQPGVNLALGNGFSDFNFGSSNTAYATTFPAPGTGAEFSYITGEKTGGLKLIAGAAQSGTGDTNHLNDVTYARVRYKIGGAGLLSGAGGVLGNEYVGVDNHVAIGASYMYAQENMLGTSWAGETQIYGADIEGSTGSLMLGAAYSRDVDLGLDNYRVEATYFLYPWLKATVNYTDLRKGDNALNDPAIAAGLTAHLRTNALLSATFTHHTRERKLVTDNTLTDTVALGAQFAF
ncbi:MAG: hypothetical protein WBP54_05560 [Pelodictyon phaeoclathratiforme]